LVCVFWFFFFMFLFGVFFWMGVGWLGFVCLRGGVFVVFFWCLLFFAPLLYFTLRNPSPWVGEEGDLVKRTESADPSP